MVAGIAVMNNNPNDFQSFQTGEYLLAGLGTLTAGTGGGLLFHYFFNANKKEWTRKKSVFEKVTRTEPIITSCGVAEIDSIALNGQALVQKENRWSINLKSLPRPTLSHLYKSGMKLDVATSAGIELVPVNDDSVTDALRRAWVQLRPERITRGERLSEARLWIVANVYMGFKFDAAYWNKRFGLPETVDVDFGRPGTIVGLYYPKIDTTVFVNKALEIQVYRWGRARR